MSVELGGLFAVDEADRPETSLRKQKQEKGKKEKKKSKTILEAEAMSEILAQTNEYVVLDIETTALMPQKGGRIIEIGAVRVRNGKIVDRYAQFIYPEMKIYKQTIELTGITNEMLQGQPVYGKALPEFHQFIGDSVIVAHNAIFDWDRFLLYYFERVGIKATNKVVDTLKLSKLYHPEQKSYKLLEVCKLHGITLDNAHRAIYDAIATAQLTISLKNKFLKDGEEHVPLLNDKEKIQTALHQKKTTFKIRRISYWEKNITKQKKMQRIYVNIGIGNVYFDISSQTWYNKDVKVPICFESLENQVLKALSLKNQVDLCFYRN